VRPQIGGELIGVVALNRLHRRLQVPSFLRQVHDRVKELEGTVLCWSHMACGPISGSGSHQAEESQGTNSVTVNHSKRVQPADNKKTATARATPLTNYVKSQAPVKPHVTNADNSQITHFLNGLPNELGNIMVGKQDPTGTQTFARAHRPHETRKQYPFRCTRGRWRRLSHSGRSLP